jgi:hypothetical protein
MNAASSVSLSSQRGRTSRFPPHLGFLFDVLDPFFVIRQPEEIATLSEAKGYYQHLAAPETLNPINETIRSVCWYPSCFLSISSSMA